MPALAFTPGALGSTPPPAPRPRSRCRACARACCPFVASLVSSAPLHLCVNSLCERSPVPDLSNPTLLALFLYLDTRLVSARFSSDARYAPPKSTHAPLGSTMSSSSTTYPCSPYPILTSADTYAHTQAHLTCSGRRMRAGPVLLRDHGSKRLEDEQHPRRDLFRARAYEHAHCTSHVCYSCAPCYQRHRRARRVRRH
jgi:hypothetical protein